jgi:predicted TIM-barrel fold metal-dependent hydrolase
MADPFPGWLGHLRERAPDFALFDAHTHIGQNDPDGFKFTTEQLLAGLEAAGARGVVFPMHEPDGYPPANDAVIAAAQASGGLLTPFCRLDPSAQPLAEAKRCLDAGAAGIKLHPRAEDFPLDAPELDDVFALAQERLLPVLVHAGRGIPALGRHAVQILARYPDMRLILAHAAICDLAWIWRAVDDHPNLFFDTSWWSTSDLLTLYAQVPPRNLLFASDAPYGSTAFGCMLNLRLALQAGLPDEAVQLVFGGQIERIIHGQEPADAGPAAGTDSLDRNPLLDRVHTFLVSSIGQMFNGLPAAETRALAGLACEVGDDAPVADTCATILRLLEICEQLIESGERFGRPSRFTPGLPFVVAAAGIARTPDVPMPPVGTAAMDVGDRAA